MVTVRVIPTVAWPSTKGDIEARLSEHCVFGHATHDTRGFRGESPRCRSKGTPRCARRHDSDVALEHTSNTIKTQKKSVEGTFRRLSQARKNTENDRLPMNPPRCKMNRHQPTQLRTNSHPFCARSLEGYHQTFESSRALSLQCEGPKVR